MAKVTAIACDNTSCDSVAKAGDNGVPANWAQVTVEQNGRTATAVVCSTNCLAAYARDYGGITTKRRRRTKAEMEADAAAANGDVPEVGTDAELTSNA